MGPFPSHQSQLIPRDSKQLTCQHALDRQANKFKAHIPNHLIYLSHTKQIFPLPCSPQLGTRQLETIPIAQRPQNYSNQPVLHCLLCPTLSFSWAMLSTHSSSFLPEEVQNNPPPNISLWHVDGFWLETLKRQPETQEELFLL